MVVLLRCRSVCVCVDTGLTDAINFMSPHRLTPFRTHRKSVMLSISESCFDPTPKGRFIIGPFFKGGFL
jgi:hypothetical protein